MDFRRLCEHEQPNLNNSPLDTKIEYNWASKSLYPYLLKHRWYGMTRKDARSGYNYALQLAALNGHLDVLEFLKDEFGITE